MDKDLKNNRFEGKIKVASGIIDDLSSGLYHSPAACLKELINNSYDADATRVEVSVKPDADRIIVEDDGHGMSKKEFKKHFERISESHKRDDATTTKSGRPKVGKIGIGFIAANELCEIMEVFSTKAGSKELLHIKINFEEMRKPLEKRRLKGGDFAKADYVGEILDAETSAHYTQIFLLNVRKGARELFNGAKPQAEGGTLKSLYGLGPNSIAKILNDPKLNTWKDFDTYSETILQVALNVPVPYHEKWVSINIPTQLRKYIEEVKNLNFCVLYDGTELRKPVVFNDEKKSFISDFKFKGKNVSAQGYFYVRHGVIKPDELQGILVRIRHAAVNEYDSSFWGFSKSESQLIQRWVSAEIWASDSLEDAMNIDRRTLRVTHPAYVELRSAIHIRLREVLKQALNELYRAGSTERKTKQVHSELKSISKTTEKLPASTAEKIKRQFREKGPDKKGPASFNKTLLKKYTVSEFFEIVTEVAQEVLQKGDVKKFLEGLVERLKR